MRKLTLEHERIVMSCPHCGVEITVPERRGGAKISAETIRQALNELGVNATQRKVAIYLNVTEQALQKYGHWAQVKASVMSLPESKTSKDHPSNVSR